jgi:hypothetical protein
VTVSAPKRIQLRRTKGWRKPEGAVRVTRPGPWGNPFAVSTNLVYEAPGLGDLGTIFPRTVEEAVRCFRRYLTETEQGRALVERARVDLRGHDLACWCAEDAEWCHADVLLELANQ